MSWGALELWWLFLVLVVIALATWLAWRAHLRKQASLGFGNAELLHSWMRGWAGMRYVLWLAGLTLITLAALQPRWGEEQRLREGDGFDIVVLLDCSRSMLAEDLYPNRLEVARRKVLDLLRLAPEHRIALVPFAARAMLRAPLTGDAAALEVLLDQCGPQLFPQQGTAMGDAVEYAVKFLGGKAERGQAILICSDGDDPKEERVQAGIDAAANAGIPVYGMFVGDEETVATIDLNGREQQVEASRETLNRFAQASGGISINTSIDDQDIEMLLQHMRTHIVARPWQESERVIASERYRLVLLPGLVCILLALALPRARRQQ